MQLCSQLAIQTLTFSKAIANNGSLCTINHNDIQSKVIVILRLKDIPWLHFLIATVVTIIFKAKCFHVKGPSLVVIFVCISSSNSYNNMLMYDIVKGIIQQC